MGQNCTGRWSFFLRITVAILTAKSFSFASRTFCSIDRTTLTCYFNEDLSERGTSFCLYRYNVDVEDTPLACNWKNSQPSCKVKPGFRAPQNVSDEFTVDLPLGSAGTYYCDTIPPGPKATKCRLEDDVVPEGQSLPPTNHFPPSSTTEKTQTCHCEETQIRLIALASVLVALLCVAVTSIIIYFSANRYKVSSFACLRKEIDGCLCMGKGPSHVTVKVVQCDDGLDFKELNNNEKRTALMHDDSTANSKLLQTPTDVIATENKTPSK